MEKVINHRTSYATHDYGNTTAHFQGTLDQVILPLQDAEVVSTLDDEHLSTVQSTIIILEKCRALWGEHNVTT